VCGAIGRLINPQQINGEIMFIVASMGISVNCVIGHILSEGDYSDVLSASTAVDHSSSGGGGKMNVRSALVHAIGDLGGSRQIPLFVCCVNDTERGKCARHSRVTMSAHLLVKQS